MKTMSEAKPKTRRDKVTVNANHTNGKQREKVPGPRSRSLISEHRSKGGTKNILRSVETMGADERPPITNIDNDGNDEREHEIGTIAMPHEAPQFLRGSSSETDLWQKLGIESDDVASEDTLDPNHPLLKRYQEAVRRHLDKMDERLTKDIRESQESVKTKRQDHDKKVLEFTSLKSEIDKLTKELMRVDDEIKSIIDSRSSHDEALAATKQTYQQLSEELGSLRQRAKERGEQLYSANRQMKQLKESIPFTNDMKIVQNAIKKAKTDLKDVQQEKQKQDMVLDRLTESEARLEHEIRQYETDISRAIEEVKEKNKHLVHINAEIQDMNAQKAGLIQQWNATLDATRKQNNTSKACEETFSMEQRQLERLKSEVSTQRKQQAERWKEREELEQIESKLKKEIQSVQRKIDTLRSQSNDLDKSLIDLKKQHQTAMTDSNKVNAEKSRLQGQLNVISKRLGQEQQELRNVEDEASAKSMASKVADGGVPAERQLRKLRLQNTNLEKDCAELEDELRKESLELTAAEEQLKSASKAHDEYQQLVALKAKEVENTEREAERLKRLADKKLMQFEALKKQQGITSNQVGNKLSSSTSKHESTKKLQKTMDGTNSKLSQLQAEWLNVQDSILRLSEQNVTAENEIGELRYSVTSYEQRKLRVEEQIRQSEKEIDSLKKLIRNLQTQTSKLNELIQKKWGDKNSLLDEHTNMQSRYIDQLKNAELEAIQLEEKLGTLSTERDRISQKIVDADNEIVTWEHKLNDAKVARKSAEGQRGKEELEQRRSRVNRLRVRYNQIMKQQDHLAKEMEKAINKRELLLARGEASAASNRSRVASSNQNSSQNIVFRLKQRIKQAEKDLEASDVEIEAARNKCDALHASLEDSRMQLWDLNEQDDELDRAILELEAQKFMNQNLIGAYQEKQNTTKTGASSKHPTATSEEMEMALVRERKRQMDLKNIADSLRQTLPAAEPALRRIEYLLQAY